MRKHTVVVFAMDALVFYLQWLDTEVKKEENQTRMGKVGAQTVT